MMRALRRNIDLEMVVDAYGYNAISRLIGNTPSNIEMLSGVRIVKCPPVAFDAASIFEYDATGKLVNTGDHLSLGYYPVKSSSTAFCEVIAGKSGFFNGDVFGTGEVTINTDFDYRFYKCPKVNGVPNNEWVMLLVI